MSRPGASLSSDDDDDHFDSNNTAQTLAQPSVQRAAASDESEDDSSANTAIPHSEYIERLRAQLNVFHTVADQNHDEARVGGARWRVLSELVAPFVGSNEPAMIDAFISAGGIELLVSIISAPPDSFVDDLYPTDRAFRPRFPAPIEMLPSALVSSSAQSEFGIDATDHSSFSPDVAAKFGRAAHAPLPPATPTLDPPGVISYRFATLFFLSVLTNHERYRAAAVTNRLVPALTALLLPDRKALLARSLFEIQHQASRAPDSSKGHDDDSDHRSSRSNSLDSDSDTGADSSAANKGASVEQDLADGEALLLEFAIADRVLCVLYNLSRSPSVPLINALVAECAQLLLGVSGSATEPNIARLAVRFFVAVAPRASASNVLRLRQLGAARALKAAEPHCQRADADSGGHNNVLLRHAVSDLLMYLDRAASRPSSAAVQSTNQKSRQPAAPVQQSQFQPSQHHHRHTAAHNTMSVGPLLEALNRVAAAQARENDGHESSDSDSEAQHRHRQPHHAQHHHTQMHSQQWQHQQHMQQHQQAQHQHKPMQNQQRQPVQHRAPSYLPPQQQQQQPQFAHASSQYYSQPQQPQRNSHRFPTDNTDYYAAPSAALSSAGVNSLTNSRRPMSSYSYRPQGGSTGGNIVGALHAPPKANRTRVRGFAMDEINEFDSLGSASQYPEHNGYYYPEDQMQMRQSRLRSAHPSSLNGPAPSYGGDEYYQQTHSRGFHPQQSHQSQHQQHTYYQSADAYDQFDMQPVPPRLPSPPPVPANAAAARSRGARATSSYRASPASSLFASQVQQPPPMPTPSLLPLSGSVHPSSTGGRLMSASRTQAGPFNSHNAQQQQQQQQQQQSSFGDPYSAPSRQAIPPSPARVRNMSASQQPQHRALRHEDAAPAYVPSAQHTHTRPMTAARPSTASTHRFSADDEMASKAAPALSDSEDDADDVDIVEDQDTGPSAFDEH